MWVIISIEIVLWNYLKYSENYTHDSHKISPSSIVKIYPQTSKIKSALTTI